MATQCTATQLPFHPFGRREVVARLDAGHLTSDGGALLLREADLRLDLTRRIAACFADGRQSGRVEHRFVARNRPQPPNQGQRPG